MNFKLMELTDLDLRPSRNSSHVTDFANGFELPGDTYTGGPTTVADNEGTLVTSPADVLPIEGMRLATTVAEGATLGPELFTANLTTGDGLIVSGADATHIVTFGVGGMRYQSDKTSPILHVSKASNLVVGKKYQFTWIFTGTGGVKTDSQTGGVYIASGVATNITASTTTWTFLRATTNVDITVSSVSVREVIPTWLPTDLSGDPIHDSTPLRTTKGTVKKYDETYKGLLIEPARTNYFLNSTVPATQNITTTAQQYTVSVKGTGSITLSGTATGVATEGSPLTVTATAGTLTCTVAGTLSRVNVEAGAFATSFIDTGATTVTRPAANLTRPTAGTALEGGNNFAIYGRAISRADGQSDQMLFSAHLIPSPLSFVSIQDNDLSIRLRKYINGVSYEPTLTGSETTKDVPLEYLAYQHSIHGMGIAVKEDGGAWSAWATNADTQNVPIASTYQIGARNNANHFAANYPFTEIIRLNPNLHPQTQLAALLAKGRI